jgi:hypothetical protein
MIMDEFIALDRGLLKHRSEVISWRCLTAAPGSDASAIHGRLGARVALLQSPILPAAGSLYPEKEIFRNLPVDKPHTHIPRFTSTTVSRMKVRRLAPANPQNSNSGSLWFPLVPSGSLGGRDRWPSAPFLRPRCGTPGSSVVKNEKLVKFGKVLVKFW